MILPFKMHRTILRLLWLLKRLGDFVKNIAEQFNLLFDAAKKKLKKICLKKFGGLMSRIDYMCVIYLFKNQKNNVRNSPYCVWLTDAGGCMRKSREGNLLWLQKSTREWDGWFCSRTKLVYHTTELLARLLDGG